MPSGGCAWSMPPTTCNRRRDIEPIAQCHLLQVVRCIAFARGSAGGIDALTEGVRGVNEGRAPCQGRGAKVRKRGPSPRKGPPTGGDGGGGRQEREWRGRGHWGWLSAGEGGSGGGVNECREALIYSPTPPPCPHLLRRAGRTRGERGKPACISFRPRILCFTEPGWYLCKLSAAAVAPRTVLLRFLRTWEEVVVKGELVDQTVVTSWLVRRFALLFVCGRGDRLLIDSIAWKEIVEGGDFSHLFRVAFGGRNWCGGMGDSSGSVSVDVEMIPWGGQEHIVQTSHGPISVFVCGDQEKPALVTYPDVALNYMSCFQGLFFCPEAASLLFHNFCIYHIDAPGHEVRIDAAFSFATLVNFIQPASDLECIPGYILCWCMLTSCYLPAFFQEFSQLGAAAISSDILMPTVDDLAEQVAEVLDYFGLGGVICMGVSAGAYILTLFALKYRERVLGLILISPLCQAPSWTEWFYSKVMTNLLYFYGMCGIVKESLLQRYFSQELRSSIQGTESDIVQACRRLLDERQSTNVMRFLQVMSVPGTNLRRYDLTEALKKLQCRTLLFVGENSPFHSEALHMSAKMDKRFNALVEVQACGSLVTEEQPHAMLIPIEYFLMGYGFYRPPQLSLSYGSSPTSPLSPSCISPELLSPESLGLKLKPIKTRVSIDEARR
eukprot:Gb_01692 [translate_table: standard]